MEEILSDIKSGRWWFSTVFVAIAVGLITNVIFEIVIKRLIENRNCKINNVGRYYNFTFDCISIIFGLLSGFIFAKTKSFNIIITNNFLFVFTNIFFVGKYFYKIKVPVIINMILVVMLYVAIELFLFFCIDFAIVFFVYYKSIIELIFVISFISFNIFCILPIAEKLSENIIFSIFLFILLPFGLSLAIYDIYNITNSDYKYFFILQGGLFGFIAAKFSDFFGELNFNI